MSTPSHADQLTQARDLLRAVIREHAIRCQDKECTAVAELLGWLAHSIGASPRDIKHFPRFLFRFEAECQGSAECRQSVTAFPLPESRS